MAIVVDTILYNDITLTLKPANIALDRKDLVIVCDGVISVAYGTPSHAPNYPMIPKDSRILAEITVNRAQTCIEQIHIREMTL
jgi:hypothetical protein